MALFVITSKHDPVQCLQALDEIAEKGSDTLDKFVYGCRDGDHTAYAIVDAANDKEALSLVPDSLLDSACITRVDKFTAEEIESFHTRAA